MSKIEKYEIQNLLKRQNIKIKDDLQQMWYLMDLVWDDYQCDNTKLNWANIERFYHHPVWLLNGLFIEQHTTSMYHRHVISDWIVQNGFNNVVDYGGGFGTLAILIAEKGKDINVNIYEPHPSSLGIKRASDFQNIKIIDKLNSYYDCLVCTDVLEHVSNPLKVFSEMIESVHPGGYLLVANAFYPMIKCHLPKHFHLRYSFNILARIMGLEVIGLLEGSHATIFRKYKSIKPNWCKIKLFEKVSEVFFKLIELFKPILKAIVR